MKGGAVFILYSALCYSFIYRRNDYNRVRNTLKGVLLYTSCVLRLCPFVFFNEIELLIKKRE
jgi:hypothetical protein